MSSSRLLLLASSYAADLQFQMPIAPLHSLSFVSRA